LVTVSSRQKLLNAASEILRTESFSRLSIDHIAERAGLSRRTFFLHFDSKDTLLAEVLQQLRPVGIKKREEWSRSLPANLSAGQRITAFFEALIEEIERPDWRGSLFIRLSSEFAELRGHPVHKVVAEANRDVADWFKGELQTGGYSAPSLIAEELMLLFSGLLVRQLAEPSHRHGEALLIMLPGLLATGQTSVSAQHAR
jgi:AcrR family transcriptional regulator